MIITLKERLGSGGNGTVYLARDEQVGRDVAVKFFDNSFDSVRTQVDQHITALREIQHQNVVSIYGVTTLCRPDGRPDGAQEMALIMEYVPGESFGEWLARPGKGLDELEQFGEGLLAGLGAFHERKLAHGDLHSANIRISSNVTKILDPMEHDPQAVRTTALTAKRMAADVRAALRLLAEAARDIGMNHESLAILTVCINAEGKLHRLDRSESPGHRGSTALAASN